MAVLDDIDRRMIDCLRLDGRMSMPALAEAVGVSRATAYARFDRLVERGVITGFTARIDPRALDLGVSALLMVNVDQGRWRDLQRELAALPGVDWVGVATGPFDFVIHTRAQDLEHLRDVVLDELQAIEGVRATNTIVLLDEQVPLS